MCVVLFIFIFFFFFYFFFKAEDGIRDLTVTGVQTCALPISSAISCKSRFSARTISRANSRSPRPRSEERRVGKSVDLGGRRIIKKKQKTQNTCSLPDHRQHRAPPSQYMTAQTS